MSDPTPCSKPPDILEHVLELPAELTAAIFEVADIETLAGALTRVSHAWRSIALSPQLPQWAVLSRTAACGRV